MSEKIVFETEQSRAELKVNGSYSAIAVEFDRADGCGVIKATLDGERCIGKIMCIRNYYSAQLATAELEPFEGEHTLVLECMGRLVMKSVELLAQMPKSSYIPVSDSKIEDYDNTSWVATDELDRRVKNCEDVRGVRKDKQVGIFYWTWRDEQSSGEPLSMEYVLDKYPDAIYNEKHPVWTIDGRGTTTFWSEPLYGYYLNRDKYIIRHHATLLTNAGVDFLLFDCTNGSLVWKSSYEPLFEGLREAKADGINVPKVAFMLNFGECRDTEKMLRALYQDLYKPGNYSDLWYYLDGKPMIMAYKHSLDGTGEGDFDNAMLDEIRNFFTFRCGQPSYGFGCTREEMWGWLEKAPQHKFGERADGSCEMMTVGVAQNCTKDDLCTYFNADGSFGRSYTNEFGHALLDENSYKYGYNFQEQWDRAIDCDPDIVFVTGWNEWIMGRWHEPWVKDKYSTKLAFVDQYDKEHSRDIEPDIDGTRDNYYLQLCSNIRRFKGAKPRVRASAPKTINDFADFADVLPAYRSYKGLTIHRDCKGFGSTHYTNDTGRNDIIAARVARDSEKLYFWARTAEPLTAPQGENWMTLLINANRSRDTGWEGYDFAVNRCEVGSVECYTPMGWSVCGKADVKVNGNELIVTIDKSVLGIDGDYFSFEFKWADNLPTDDIINFYRNGSTAPIGRFNFLYQC